METAEKRTKQAELRGNYVRLEPEAQKIIDEAAARNRRGVGPEIAFRIEDQIRRESEGAS